ncbi:MAG: hypothetical protein LIO80_02440 [Lachnospiraceae bacterium]|nr:hypothetical protein [Lachnospiraceae bacterium]
MNNDELKNNAAFQNLSPEKLQFIMNFMNQEKSDNARDMMAMLMAFSGKAKKQGIRFSDNETDFIIEHLKESMSPEERQKTDMILRLMKQNRS